MKKLIFVVLDGAADTPNPEIGGKTAFEAADIPNIDFLARNGKNGILQVLPIPPESDEAVLSLLGYDVFKVYTGRGPLEAVGGGVPFKDGNLALRCNFATEKNDEIVNVRAGRISDAEARELAYAINEKVTLTNADFVFKSVAGYRSVLVLKSKEALSPNITNTHPGYKLRLFDIYWDRNGNIKSVPMSEAVSEPILRVQKCKPLDKTKASSVSALLVNEFIEKSKVVLENHPINKRRIKEGKPPANIVITRNPGIKLPKLSKLTETTNMRWAAFVDMPVEKGIAILSGMDVIPLPLPTENVERDMTIRVLTLLKNLQLYDAFYIHLKGPDVYGHLGDINGKIKSVEMIDKYFFRPLLKNIDLMNTTIIVTSDHTTSTEKHTHTEDPVPVTVFGVGMPDDVSNYSESSCAKGTLGEMSAKTFLGKVIRMMRENDREYSE
jgi:2,3-bisphosphoglycerate-independent phosphoglycerate mutase